MTGMPVRLVNVFHPGDATLYEGLHFPLTMDPVTGPRVRQRAATFEDIMYQYDTVAFAILHV
jgi:hypothetical protein